jgi:hypothetical protein
MDAKFPDSRKRVVKFDEIPFAFVSKFNAGGAFFEEIFNRSEWYHCANSSTLFRPETLKAFYSFINIVSCVTAVDVEKTFLSTNYA